MADRSATRRVDELVAKLAAERWGVFALDQARSLGLSADMASDRARAGRLWRLQASSRGPLACRGPRLRARRRAVPHRRSRALGDPPHPLGRDPRHGPATAGRKQRPGITIHRSSTLLTSQTTLRSAIPVTQPARTLADLRKLLPAEDWERSRSRALDRHYHLGSLGDGAVPSFSVLEQRLKNICRRHRLPLPEPQQIIGPYTVDFCWPEALLVVEVDDFGTHGTRAKFESDRERDAWLQLRGYRVVRFT